MDHVQDNAFEKCVILLSLYSSGKRWPDDDEAWVVAESKMNLTEYMNI